MAQKVREYAQSLYKVQYSTADDKIKEVRDLIEKELGKDFAKEFGNSLDDTTSKSEKLLSKLNSFSSAFKKAFNFSAIAIALRKVWQVSKDLVNASVDMTETNNLFEVSMGKVVNQYDELDEEASKYYTRALAFQNEMNEKLATNRAEMMKYQAMYYSMFTSQDINKEASYIMSESLTKAGYDIASLYNLSVDEAMEKLKSGIAGQVEPLRKIGVDISESALTKVIRDAGITDRSVQQLSYAEKEVARYIAIVNQAGKAQGDFVKTMDNSANQIKIFKNQLAELKQVAGSFITNAFGGILVYINGFIMALKEILKAFANLLGYDLNSGGSNLSEQTGVDDLNTGLGTATSKAKELKKQLMGFDEINNITPPSASGGSGGGLATGVDDRLLDRLKEWNNQMEGISGKAQEFRDKILETLGFERNDDGTWKLGEGYTTFEKILDIVKAIGLAILGWKVSGAILKIFSLFGKTPTAVGALKFSLGLTIAIEGIALIFGGVKKYIEAQEFTAENILKTIGGSALVGVGGALLFGSGVIGFSIAGLTLFIAGSIMYENTELKGMTDFIHRAIKSSGADSKLVEKVEVVLKVTQFTWNLGDCIAKWFGTDLKTIIQDAIFKNMKEILEWLAGIVENFGDIGKQMAKAIRRGIEESEKDILTEAQKVSKETAEEISAGWKSDKTKMSWRNALSESGKTALINAKTDLTEKCNELGRNSVDSIIEGQNSKTGELVSSTATLANSTVNEFNSKLNGTTAGANFVKTASDEINRQTGTLTSTADTLATNTNNTFASKLNGRTAGTNLITSASQGIESQKQSLFGKASNVGGEINSRFNSSTNAKSIGSNIISGISSGMTSTANGRNGLFSTIASIGSNILKKFKKVLDIKSPSRVMRDMVGRFIPEGIAVGIDQNADTVYASMNQLAEGIKVNTKDFMIDTNQYVDYGAISGQIQTQSNVSMSSNIVQGIAQAVSYAMQNAEVNVNIEAKTEEGVIVKKASQGFKDYVMQTGELPFPVPV